MHRADLEHLPHPEHHDRLWRILTGREEPETVEQTAEWVRQCFHRPSDAELQMHAADVLLGGFGVEAIRPEGAYVDSYHFDVVAEYVNFGDTYDMTLVYDTDEGEFYVTSWGGWLEAWEQEREADNDTP